MRDEEYEYRSFQQGGVNTHTANKSMATLHDILVDCIISYPSWSASWSDQILCEYYLWGYSIDVYKNNTNTGKDSSNEIIWYKRLDISRQQRVPLKSSKYLHMQYTKIIVCLGLKKVWKFASSYTGFWC